VVSAAPREVIESALAGSVAPEHIFGTELEYDAVSGEVQRIRRVPAGYGKVAVLEELERRLGITPDRMIYVGDGSSDVHVMLHVNSATASRLPCPRTGSSPRSRAVPC
jgi:Phosphoserine phosphatase